MKRRYLTLALLGFLLGCSEENHSTKAPDNGALKAQFKNIDKAKLAERQIKDAAAKQRRAIEEQGG
jgi:hypothetical protein